MPLLLSMLEHVEAEIEAGKKASIAADFDSIRETELQAYIAAQRAKLPEMRKKTPSAYIDDEGKLCYIPGMDREPTEAEIRAASRWSAYSRTKERST